MSADREKAIRGIEACNHMGREAYRGGCTRCPYFNSTYEIGKDCRQALDDDLYEILTQGREKKEVTGDAAD